MENNNVEISKEHLYTADLWERLCGGMTDDAHCALYEGPEVWSQWAKEAMRVYEERSVPGGSLEHLRGTQEEADLLWCLSGC